MEFCYTDASVKGEESSFAIVKRLNINSAIITCAKLPYKRRSAVEVEMIPLRVAATLYPNHRYFTDSPDAIRRLRDEIPNLNYVKAIHRHTTRNNDLVHGFARSARLDMREDKYFTTVFNEIKKNCTISDKTRQWVRIKGEYAQPLSEYFHNVLI